MEIDTTARLDQWWKPKASNLLAVLYVVMLLTGMPFLQSLKLFFPSVLTILGIGTFGHFINDLFDQEIDRKANKQNQMAALPAKKKIGLIALSLFASLVPWIILPWNNFSLLLLITEFAVLLAYAIPPVRAKERKIWAIFFDSAYAYALPGLLAAYTFNLAGRATADVYFLFLLFLWQYAYGIRHYLNHLATDQLNDKKAGLTTLATIKGNAFIHGLVTRHLLPVEIILFITLQVYLLRTGAVFSAFILLAFSITYLVQLVQSFTNGYKIFAYRFSTSIIDSFYQYAWVYIPLFFLCRTDPSYAVLILLHWTLFHLYVFRRSRLISFSSGLLYRLYYTRALYFLGYPFVILIRKLIVAPRLPEKKITYRQSTQTYIQTVKRRFFRTGVNIAVVNINKLKYTETFINELLPRLKYNVFYLYGGELPARGDDGIHLLVNRKRWRALLAFIEACFNLEPGYFLKQSIANYLQSNNIQLVLAEFGPVGANLISITRSIGVPLIVNFHGYDIYHREEVKKYQLAYYRVFKEAERIIAVSGHMIEKLAALGVAREKLFELPAYVNLALFPCVDHGSVLPRFIAVGRFAETKSPHLTILAFHEVVKQIPAATLTLIGKGGGGELFEACVILVRSLALQSNVFFKEIVSHEQVAAEMAAARIFVQHSVTTPCNGDMEGKPVAIMEAMACGLPVIATIHSGIAELIEHNVNGYLVEEYDIKAMSEAMLLLATDNRLVTRLGMAAGKSIHEHPLVSRHLEILEGLIDSAIAQ